MIGAALSPVIVMLVMWINVIYALTVGDVIFWWEWLIISIYTIAVIGFITYKATR